MTEREMSVDGGHDQNLRTVIIDRTKSREYATLLRDAGVHFKLIEFSPSAELDPLRVFTARN